MNMRTDGSDDNAHIDALFVRLGKSIASRRKYLKMSKRAVARAAGMPEATYRYLEEPDKRPTAPTKGPTFGMVAAVAAGLQLELWQLVVPDFKCDQPARITDPVCMAGVSDDERRLLSWLREDASGSRIAGILLSHGLAGSAASAPNGDESGGVARIPWAGSTRIKRIGARMSARIYQFPVQACAKGGK